MRRAMVLCHMIGIETEAIVCLGQYEAVGILSRDITSVLVQMIKDAAGYL